MDDTQWIHPHCVYKRAICNHTHTHTAAAVGKPKARVPYSSISSSCVLGFPKGLKFGPPSSFSVARLKRILDCADDISFTGMLKLIL